MINSHYVWIFINKYTNCPAVMSHNKQRNCFSVTLWLSNGTKMLSYYALRSEKRNQRLLKGATVHDAGVATHALSSLGLGP